MGRKTDPKCLYCARNYATEDEALSKHPECYVTKNRLCYYKRHRIRNASQINARRRDRTCRKQGVETLPPILPLALWVEFVVYGVKDKTVHAIALKIYQGNKLKYKMMPQHTLGLSLQELKDYVDKIMDYLQSKYGIDRIGRYYWVHQKYCPVCTGEKF